jgi:ABC transport system ATP-binding/permease protein
VSRIPYAFNGGDFNHVIITLIAMTNTALLVGGMALMRELVKEREIYKRERMVNLRFSSYMLSKVWFALVLALYQTACFVVIRYLAFDMPGGFQEAAYFFLTVFLLIVAGMMMGLFSSALAPNANAAPLLMILFVIPQMVFGGALVPLPDPITAPASSRWAFQSILAIYGAGSDVAADPCWVLPKEQRDSLTLDQKNTMCKCMGVNALHEDSCNFPGLGQYYVSAIDQKDPQKPADPPPQPAQPQFPPAPPKPTDFNSLPLLQKYLSDLTAYNSQVDQIRSKFQQEMDAWQEQQKTFQTQIETYQKDLTDLEVRRSIAIGSAESSIDHYRKDYGWTFVDKNNHQEYMQTLLFTWGAQLVIILVLFAGTVIIQRRREVL